MPMPFVGNTLAQIQTGQLGSNTVLDKRGVMQAMAQKFGITDANRVAQNTGTLNEGSADNVWTPGVGSIDHDAAMKLYQAGVGGISDTMTDRTHHTVSLDKRNGSREELTKYSDRKPTFMDQAVPTVLNMLVGKYMPVMGLVMNWAQKENAKVHPTDMNNPNSYVGALQAQAGDQWGTSQAARTGSEQANTGVVPPRRSIDPGLARTPVVPNFGDTMIKQKMLMAMLQSHMQEAQQGQSSQPRTASSGSPTGGVRV